MAQVVKLKRSSVAGNVPTSGQMTPGELAMNTADGKLFLRDNTDIRPIVTVDAEITGSLNLIGNITASGDISASGNITGKTGSFDYFAFDRWSPATDLGSSTYIDWSGNSTNPQLLVSIGGTQALKATKGALGDNIILNPGGANYSFKVKGNTSDNLLFVSASNNRVGINTNSPQSRFHVVGNISASTYTGFGTDLQIASASNIDNLYITEFRETGSNFNQSEGQPEIGSVLVLDISGSGDGNESVLRRMDFQAFNKAFYASASFAKLLEISESIASDVAVGSYVNGLFFANGLNYDLDQDGVVGASDILIMLTAYGQTLVDPNAQGSPTINKQQLSDLNAIHEGNGDTQVISGSLYLTTSSISGSYLDLLANGTLFIESHFTSSGKILGNGLTINGDTTLNSNIINLGVDSGDRIGINSHITTRLDIRNNITASGNISSSGELIGIINGGSF